MNDIDLLEGLAVAEARGSFSAYRQYIGLKPALKLGWWQSDAANHLQQFYDDLVVGKKPSLVIRAPPQHGKSRLIIEFVSWVYGKHPENKTIYASVSGRLGIRANLTLQRIISMPKFKKCFPDDSGSTSGLLQQQNRSIIENSSGGGFRNTTVYGEIIGESLDLGVIDDPIKGRAKANSPAIRSSTWGWLTNDFFTRFSEDAGMLVILTRWHHDDPVGRLAKIMPALKTVTYKAIATEDEANRKIGEALFPQHKSLAFLLTRKKTMSSEDFEALYQQSPQISGGNMIKIADFKRHDNPPANCRIVQSWDTAQKAARINDPSVCTTWAIADNMYYLLDVVVIRALFPELRRTAESLWLKWNPDTVLIEDKSSGTSLIQDLTASTMMPVISITPCADKVTRLSSCLSMIEAGRVSIPKSASWMYDFETELAAFPVGEHDDQVDSVTQFLNWMMLKKEIMIGR